jgi:hypothetical protein
MQIKDILKLDIKTIIIAVLVIVILLMRTCTPSPNFKPGKVVYLDGKPFEVVKHTTDTQYVPKPFEVIKKGKDIYRDTPIYIPVPQDVDTAEILKDYFAKNVYKDTLKLKDSMGYIAITDTITKNSIASRQFKANVKQMVIRDSVILKEKLRNQLYIGGNLGVTNNGVFNYFGPSLLLKTKTDKIYNIGAGINNTQGISVQGGMYWKIKLKK